MLVGYLAGGMHDNIWRERIKQEVSKIHWIDPVDNKFSDSSHYSTWDVEAVKQSDIIVCHMSDDNPSGFGMSIELGLAYAWQKSIIFINELTDKRLRYFRFHEELSNINVVSVTQAIEVLKKFQLLK